MKKAFLAMLLAGIWITASEFCRNELLFKSYWTEHFDSLGLKFETLPINGVLWMLWSFVLSFIIYMLIKRFSFIQTMFIAWLAAFFMMWLTIYNLQVLPLEILIFAVPLSLIEVFLADVILYKMLKSKQVLKNGISSE